jgi:ubiquinone/menaquinone biosynthesis C-methylase UbiE
MSSDEREAYWDNNYADYWKARVKESVAAGHSSVIAGDPKTESDDIYERVFEANPFMPGRVLDVGCAWGRMFDLYLKRGLLVYGVDISAVMVAEARSAWSQVSDVLAIEKAPAETLPFADGEFDNLVCVATFDATYQHAALAEFIRVVKAGGLIYLTGKNDRYEENDEAALAAEIGARSKRHPNHFTDTVKLRTLLARQGHCIEQAYYFPRRGDFAEWNMSEQPIERFYEYFLVIRRSKLTTDDAIFTPFSDAFSRTFSEFNG